LKWVIKLSNGIEAIEQIHQEKLELVILDKELTDFSRMAIIRFLRADGDTDKLPIVLVGSTLKEEDTLLGLEVGADFCLDKTFYHQVFIARLRSVIRRTGMMKNLIN